MSHTTCDNVYMKLKGIIHTEIIMDLLDAGISYRQIYLKVKVVNTRININRFALLAR